MGVAIAFFNPILFRYLLPVLATMAVIGFLLS
jgi:hypothetical protein